MQLLPSLVATLVGSSMVMEATSQSTFTSRYSFNNANTPSSITSTSSFTPATSTTTSRFTTTSSRYTPTTISSFTPASTTTTTTAFTPASTSATTENYWSSITGSTISRAVATSQPTKTVASSTSSMIYSPMMSRSTDYSDNSEWISGSTGNSDDLFNPETFRTWNVDIKSWDLKTLNDDPTAEEWVPCTVYSDYGTPREEKYEGAGCRYKGSVGSLRLCMNENTWKFDMTLCRKLSLKVNINKFSEGKQKIYGMKTLLFNGAPMDFSLMSERVSYALMEVLGLTAARAVHTQVSINGKNNGVYVMVEPIDKIFTKKHFKQDFNKGKGAVFKEAWLNDPNLDFASKQSDGDVDESNFMRDAVLAIESTPDSQAYATLERYFDIDALVNAVAFNELVFMTDDWRMRHNFYWYVREDENGKKLVYLPWDYDRLMDEAAKARGATGIQGPWYQTLNKNHWKCTQRIKTIEQKALATCAGDTPGYCRKMRAIYSELPVDVDIPVQCDRITALMSIALKDKIAAKVLEFSQIFTMPTIENFIDIFSAQIKTALAKDPDGPTTKYWNPAVRDLINWLRDHRADAIQKARDGYSTYTPSIGSSYTPGQFGGRFTPISKWNSGNTGTTTTTTNSRFSPSKFTGSSNFQTVSSNFRQGSGASSFSGLFNRIG